MNNQETIHQTIKIDGPFIISVDRRKIPRHVSSTYDHIKRALECHFEKIIDEGLSPSNRVSFSQSPDTYPIPEKVKKDVHFHIDSLVKGGIHITVDDLESEKLEDIIKKKLLKAINDLDMPIRCQFNSSNISIVRSEVYDNLCKKHIHSLEEENIRLKKMIGFYFNQDKDLSNTSSLSEKQKRRWFSKKMDDCVKAMQDLGESH